MENLNGNLKWRTEICKKAESPWLQGEEPVTTTIATVFLNRIDR
jgi:hypothetical protein